MAEIGVRNNFKLCLVWNSFQLNFLCSKSGHPIVDLMLHPTEEPPKPNERVLCRHPFQESKRAYVVPARVVPLLKEFWRDGHVVGEGSPHIKELRDRAMREINNLRDDHKRDLNPTPYKVSISDMLYNELHRLWLSNAPIGELS
jgi:nicotinate phosphoribosyltransferase